MPFCDWLNGNETEYKKNSDIVLKDKVVTAFISPKWWINNSGHVIIIPNNHVENLYEIDDAMLSHMALATKRIAVAIRKTYEERARQQPRCMAFSHHVFPRYHNDKLYENHTNNRFVASAERAVYATKLRHYFMQPS